MRTPMALLVLLLALLACSSSQAGSVGVLWDNPTQYTDDSPLTDFRGCFVQFWARSAPATLYTTPVIAAPMAGGGVGSVDVRGLVNGWWVFRARAVCNSGAMSDWSNTIAVDVIGRSKAPINLRFR